MKSRRKHRQVSLILLAAAVIYVVSYCCFSACGEYQFSQSGRVRYGFGLSVSDIVIWQPKFLRWHCFTNTKGEAVTRGNILGCAYCPLIAFDRWLVHPTRPALESSTELLSPDALSRVVPSDFDVIDEEAAPEGAAAGPA